MGDAHRVTVMVVELADQRCEFALEKGNDGSNDHERDEEDPGFPERVEEFFGVQAGSEQRYGAFRYRGDTRRVTEDGVRSVHLSGPATQPELGQDLQQRRNTGLQSVERLSEPVELGGDPADIAGRDVHGVVDL